MPIIVQHGRIDRKVIAQLKGSPSFAFRSREPVEYDLAFVGWQESFKVIKNCFHRPDTVDRDDLATSLSTALQDMLKHPLLNIQ